MARAANTYRANQNPYLTHDQKVSVRARKQSNRQNFPRFIIGPRVSGKEIIQVRTTPLDIVSKIHDRMNARDYTKRWNGVGDKHAKFSRAA